MTDTRHSSRLLPLYPRYYRASHGAEILQTGMPPREPGTARALGRSPSW